MAVLPKLRIVSGAQTGVDRAALDVALALGLPCGGWVPHGRRAEDGPVARHYPVRETPSRSYGERTRRNVRDSDATLILTRSTPTGGTALTASAARAMRRPCCVVNLVTCEPDPAAVRDWMDRHRVRALNVAGPRESTTSGIYDDARDYLTRLLDINGT
jgi:hypothetical protein